MFQIDVLSRTPVYEQLVRQLERFLLSGVLRPGDQLPSIRSVALTHSINPRTILHAYGELEQRELITAVQGRGFFVRADARETLLRDQEARLEHLRQSVTQMALAGVSEEQILRTVRDAYRAAEPNNERGEDR